MGAIPLKGVINHFPQVGGNRTTEASEVVFDPFLGDEGVETSSLSPPVGGCLHSFRRDWLANKCSDVIILSPMLRSSIHLKTKFSQSSPDSIRLQGPSKRPSSGLLYPVSSVKGHNKKGGKCKISWVYTRLFLVPKPHQRWRPVIDLSRLNTFLLVERFKMETPESIRTSLIPGKWVSSIDLSDAYFHIPIHPNSRKYLKVLSQVTGVPVHLPSLRASHGPSGLYNDYKRSEADGPDKGNQTLPVPGRLTYQIPVSGRSTSEHSDSGRSDPVLRVDNKSGEIQTKTYSSVFFVGYEYHLDSVLVATVVAYINKKKRMCALLWKIMI